MEVLLRSAVRLTSCLLACGILAVATAAGAELDSHSFRFAEKKDPPRVEWDFRFKNPQSAATVEAAVGEQTFPAQFTPFSEIADAETAFLFLIDKSDPKRAKTIEAVKALVLQLIERATPREHCAVYAFDSDLVPVADFGTPIEVVSERLKAVKAVGLATELFRDTIEALKVLQKTPAARRALIVLSDGKAEDTSFTLEQAIAAAKEAGVVIYGVGYTETPQGTVHLQSLRRLAAETGGPFAEAAMKTRLVPEDFVSDFYAFLESGGLATVDLSGLTTGTDLNLHIRVPGQPETLEAAYKLTTLAPPPPPAPKPVEEIKPVATPEPAPSPKAAESVKHSATLPVLLTLLLLAGAGAAWFFLLRPRLAETNGPIFARLQVLDGDGTEVLMRHTALRVGRGKDNDLALKNDTVSRHHAEIHRTREGDFTITELNAGNGVLVNGEQVAKATLKHEDIIELGEVRLRFLIV